MRKKRYSEIIFNVAWCLFVAVLCASCTSRVDDCVAAIGFVETTSGEPIIDACVEFTTTRTLGGQSADDYLNSHPVFEEVTGIYGNLVAPFSMTIPAFSVSMGLEVVDPIWVARLTLPDRTETIVFQRQNDGNNPEPLRYFTISEFGGSASESITVQGVGAVGCGAALVPDENPCLDVP